MSYKPTCFVCVRVCVYMYVCAVVYAGFFSRGGGGRILKFENRAENFATTQPAIE